MSRLMFTDNEKKSTLIILLLILVIDLTSFTCILPLFPSILDYYSQKLSTQLLTNNTITSENRDYFFEFFEFKVKNLQNFIGVPDSQRYNNVFFGGILGSLFSFLQYLSSPIFGALSDVYGRKPILLISICGSLFSYYLWSIADSFGLFIASRIIGGLSKASVSIAIAIVTDILTINARGKGMAFVGVSFSIAFISGPIIGAYFSSTTNQLKNVNFNSAPAKFAINSTIIELLLIILLLPETLVNSSLKLSEIFSSIQNYVLPHRLFNFSILKTTINKNIVKNNEMQKENDSIFYLRKYSQLYFVFLFLYSALEFTLCFLTHIRFDYDGMKQGRLYFFSGILMILVQGGYVRRIPLKSQEKGVFIGLCAVIPAFIIISLSFNQILLYIGLSFYAIASALVVPCLTTLISSHCEESKKGSCMGVFRSIGALARACGPIFGSFLFWLFGPMYSYLFGAILLIIPLIQLLSIKNYSLKSNSKNLLKAE